MHELPSPRVVSLPSLWNGPLHDSGLTQMPLLSSLQAGQYAAQEQRHIHPVMPKFRINLVSDLLIKVAVHSIAMATIDRCGMPRELLATLAGAGESHKGRIVHLEEENALLRHCLFGRKSEQTADPATPQLGLVNKLESITEPVDDSAEEVFSPTKPRGKRKPLTSVPKHYITND